MARTVRGGLIQCANPINDPARPLAEIRDAAIARHLPMIEEAGKKGVQILCLQEIFAGPYFCPSQDSRWCDLAEPVPGPTVEMLTPLARKQKGGALVACGKDEHRGAKGRNAFQADRASAREARDDAPANALVAGASREPELRRQGPQSRAPTGRGREVRRRVGRG